MSLSALFAMPEEQSAWPDWSFNHAALHFDIVRLLTAQHNVTGLDQFILHPMDLSNLGMWLYQHQVMHNQANAALGTTGYNLLVLDWRDSDQLREWLFLNGSEHQVFAQNLKAE